MYLCALMNKLLLFIHSLPNQPMLIMKNNKIYYKIIRAILVQKRDVHKADPCAPS